MKLCSEKQGSNDPSEDRSEYRKVYTDKETILVEEENTVYEMDVKCLKQKYGER